MADATNGPSDNGPKWPGPVTFNDDDPKKGFSTIFLTVKGLQVNKAFMGLGKATPKNATIKPEFTPSLVKMFVTINDSQTVDYEYRKPLPEDIDPDKCNYKVKNGMVVLTLCKKSGESWAQHAKYLIKKESTE